MTDEGWTNADAVHEMWRAIPVDCSGFVDDRLPQSKNRTSDKSSWNSISRNLTDGLQSSREVLLEKRSMTPFLISIFKTN